MEAPYSPARRTTHENSASGSSASNYNYYPAATSKLHHQHNHQHHSSSSSTLINPIHHSSHQTGTHASSSSTTASTSSLHLAPAAPARSAQYGHQRDHIELASPRPRDFDDIRDKHETIDDPRRLVRGDEYEYRQQRRDLDHERGERGGVDYEREERLVRDREYGEREVGREGDIRTTSHDFDTPTTHDAPSRRDFVHAHPPPLRRLSAPSVSLAVTNSSLPLPPLPSPSALARHPQQHQQHAYLPPPPPSLSQRTHSRPAAIAIPSYSQARFKDQPQTAPLQPTHPFNPHTSSSSLHPPRSAGLRPTSPVFPGGRFARRNSLLAPPFVASGHSSASSASSSIGLDDRALRSPHPPLTAIYPSHNWPPPLPAHLQDREADEFQRPYLSSPLGDHFHRSELSAPATRVLPPLHSPAFLPPSNNLLAPPKRDSPLRIAPPLRFKYSASPTPGDMPPRKKAPDSGATVTSTVSSTRSSRRVAEHSGGLAPGGKGNGWTMEHTYDSVGQPKEVIVIQDSTSPIPKKRTRAAVAAAALGADPKWANGVANGSAARKRKAEEDDALAKKAKKLPPSGQRLVPALPPAPAQPAQPAPATTQAQPWDDAEGHYIVKPDDVIGGRYKIVRLLGQGTFGKVVEARHIESRKKVAIKVIRAVQKYRDASKIEIRVLETLKKNDPGNAYKCIHLTEYFDFRNHPCLVSELYGMSVFDFLKQNSFQPFPDRHIQDFAKSLLRSVQFLHSLKLVHTDLKPENILLVKNESRLQGPRRAGARSKQILRDTDIRLIDFGSATFENEYHSSVVSTRHYRAPEIILNMSWSYPCDMFSIGCILVEFFTGDALFQTHDNLEHLAMMEVVMGKMPPRMIERGKQKKGEFFKGNKIDFPNPSVSKSSRKFVKGLKSLKEIIPPTNNTNALFLDLVVRLLDFDPETRITVDKALEHAYLRHSIPEPPA